MFGLLAPAKSGLPSPSMSFRIATCAAPGGEIVRIIRFLAKDAARKAGSEKHPPSERIHVARSSCKKMRAALLLIRRYDARFYKRENAWLRNAARRLARYRDDDVMIARLQDLSAGRPVPPSVRKFFSAQRSQLEARREVDHSSTGTLGQELHRFVQTMRVVSRRLPRHALHGLRFKDVTAGYVATYRKAREAMPSSGTAADPRFHEWRKWTKMCGHQSRLLRGAWPAVMKARSKAYTELGDVLGAEHDLTVLHDFLKEHGGTSGPAAAKTAGLMRVAERRRKLREQAIVLGRRLFADKPRVAGEHLTLFWKASLATGKCPVETRGRQVQSTKKTARQERN